MRRHLKRDQTFLPARHEELLRAADARKRLRPVVREVHDGEAPITSRRRGRAAPEETRAARGATAVSITASQELLPLHTDNEVHEGLCRVLLVRVGKDADRLRDVRHALFRAGHSDGRRPPVGSSGNRLTGETTGTVQHREPTTGAAWKPFG